MVPVNFKTEMYGQDEVAGYRILQKERGVFIWGVSHQRVICGDVAQTGTAMQPSWCAPPSGPRNLGVQLHVPPPGLSAAPISFTKT